MWCSLFSSMPPPRCSRGGDSHLSSRTNGGNSFILHTYELKSFQHHVAGPIPLGHAGMISFR